MYTEKITKKQILIYSKGAVSVASPECQIKTNSKP